VVDLVLVRDADLLSSGLRWGGSGASGDGPVFNLATTHLPGTTELWMCASSTYEIWYVSADGCGGNQWVWPLGYVAEGSPGVACCDTPIYYLEIAPGTESFAVLLVTDPGTRDSLIPPQGTWSWRQDIVWCAWSSL
jgi:hypothetical protein